MRIVALADSDSYVKWGAALLGALPDTWERELLVVDSPSVVSDAQLAAALAGSGVKRVSRVTAAEVAPRLAALPPDVVLVATPGPVARVLIRIVASIKPRPVIVSGLPGISIPPTRKALMYRRQADLMVLHSHREIREFGMLAHDLGWQTTFGLATLPFAERRPATGTDTVFAVQAIVPKLRNERRKVAAILYDAALADPTKRVVVKVRALAGERQTHSERIGYPALLAELGPLPENLVISAAPMNEALDTAESLVTVSSTAAIEAIARGIPVIALDTFGVSGGLINTVFIGSGLFGDRDAVVTRVARHPEPAWLADNYFHEAGDDDWVSAVETLVETRRSGRLVARSGHLSPGGRVRAVWDRKRAFGDLDRSVSGRAILVVGVPARWMVRSLRRFTVNRAHSTSVDDAERQPIGAARP